MKNYYQILGINSSADQSEIKKRYRKLAKLYHPDLNPGDQNAAETFKNINAAYETLSDEYKRAEYDANIGLNNFNHDMFQTYNRNGNINDIFSSMFDGYNPFSRRQEQKKSSAGAKKTFNLKLDTNDINSGQIKRTLNIKKNITCIDCNGQGGEFVTRCNECDGLGKIVKTYRQGNTYVQHTNNCSRCMGRGSIIKNICKSCKGLGNIVNTEKYTVDIKFTKIK